MALVGGEEQKGKPRVVLYFEQSNGDTAKDFAGRMRIADRVDVTLVWSKMFKDEVDVMGGIGAIVIEQGCVNGEMIAKMYEHWSPDTEIHYMTREGQWANDADEEPNQPKKPVVSAETATPASTRNAGSDEEDVAGKVAVAAVASRALSDGPDGDVDVAEHASDSDPEGHSGED